MDDASRMERGERVEELQGDVTDTGRLHPPVVKQGGERDHAGDVVVGDVALAVGHPEVEGGDEMRVPDAGRQATLLDEPRHQLRVVLLALIHELERHGSLRHQVASAKDAALSSGAERRVDLVSAVQDTRCHGFSVSGFSVAGFSVSGFSVSVHFVRMYSAMASSDQPSSRSRRVSSARWTADRGYFVMFPRPRSDSITGGRIPRRTQSRSVTCVTPPALATSVASANVRRGFGTLRGTGGSLGPKRLAPAVFFNLRFFLFYLCLIKRMWPMAPRETVKDASFGRARLYQAVLIQG